jgi:predicted PurR-regulated permease PerM
VSQSIVDPTQPTGSSPAEVPLVPAPARAVTTTTAERERRPGLTPFTLFLTLLIAYVLIQVQLVLILVLLAILFATAIERPVQLLERRHVPRGLGILAVYVALIAGLTFSFILLAPAIGDQATNFREQAPERLRDLRADWIASRNPLLHGPGQDLLRQGIDIIADPSPEVSVPQDAAIGVATGVGGGIVGLVTVFVIAFYYLMEKSWLRRLVLLEIAPSGRERVNRVWDNVEAKVGDWLRGQLLLCLTIGLLATVGYGVLQVPFWPVLGLWAGLTEIIPIVGPWIGGVPAVVIALTKSWNTALLVIGFIILIQMLENAVLVPRIMRGAVGLTPLTVFVAILTGTQFLGIPGALLAIPLAAVVQVVVSDYLSTRREARQADGPPLPGWRWMRGPLAPVPIQPIPVDPAERSSQPPLPTASTATPSPPPSPAPDAPPAAPGWTSDVLARITNRPRSED